MSDVIPEIERACKVRENYRKDVDSYKRRYLAAERKAASAKLPDAREKANSEREKFHQKFEKAKKLYETQDALVKGDLEKAKIARDEAVEMMTVTVAACQMELFEQCHRRLTAACSNFPGDKMKQVRQSIQNEIRAGGPSLSAEAPSVGSRAKKVANIITGKVTLSDYKREAKEEKARGHEALLRAKQVFQEEGKVSGVKAFAQSAINPRNGGEKTSTSIGAVSQPPPPPRRLCTAMFDNEPDSPGELGFKEGDQIRIMKRDDEGWWTGELVKRPGEVGIFPANFVKLD